MLIVMQLIVIQQLQPQFLLFLLRIHFHITHTTATSPDYLNTTGATAYCDIFAYKERIRFFKVGHIRRGGFKIIPIIVITRYERAFGVGAGDKIGRADAEADRFQEPR